MLTLTRIFSGLSLGLLICLPASAQTERALDAPPVEKLSQAQPTIIVTATAGTHRVRYVCIGEVHQTRLQLFSPDGTQVFDSSFRLGNLIDWQLTDQQGQRVSAGSYLFLVTVRQFSGEMAQRYGIAQLSHSQVTLSQVARDELPPAQAAALEANRLSTELSPVERVGASGVAGLTTATAPDGATVIDAAPAAASNLTPGGENLSGTGTQNHLAKWTNNSGALGDSTVTEVGGNVGIGTTTPAAKLHFMTSNGEVIRFQTTGNSQTSNSQIGISPFGDSTGGALYLGPNFFLNAGGAINRYSTSSIGWGFGFDNRPAVDSYRMFRVAANGAITTPFVVLGSGNVGIGTTSPASRLTVNGGIEILGAGNGIMFADGSIQTKATSGTINGTGTTGQIVKFTGPNSFGNSLIRENAGNIGIGTTNPSAKLDVAGAINAATQYNLNGSRILSNPGTGNLFAGAGAGAANTTGARNTFVGSSAGMTQANGFDNTFIGFEAGKSNFGGSGFGSLNTFIGSRAGAANTGGTANTFVGGNAGAANTEGISNSFFGQAGGRNLTGSHNSFFGDFAGLNNTEGSFNSFFGEATGQSNRTGSFNTVIGSQADVGNGLTNATAIGACSVAAQSNSLILGSTSSSVSGCIPSPDTNVGIGTSAPQRLMHIKGTGSGGVGVGDLLVTGTGTVGSAITLEATGSGGRRYSWLSTANEADAGGGALAAFDVTDGAYRMVINSAGNVGIGTTTPAVRLQVFGNIRMGTSGSNGCLQRFDGSAAAGTCSSDVRFKRNITPFPSLLSRVTRLRPVHYYWRAAEFPQKHFGDTQAYGLIAQEVEQVLPELVSEDAEGYKQVDYSKLPLLTIQAIKELKAENDALKQQNATLQQRNAELDARLTALEQMMRESRAPAPQQPPQKQ